MRPPPLRPEQSAPSARALARATTLARASAIVLIVLAGLSTLVNAPHPFTAHFLISIIALANGIVEWIGAGGLARRDPRAPRRLALNQMVLGAAILVYGLWRARTLLPAEILVLLERPYLRPFLEVLPPEEVTLLHDLLPPLMRAMYFAVGIGGALGCLGAAAYYWTRRRHLSAVASPG